MKKRPVLLINPPYTNGKQDATGKYGEIYSYRFRTSSLELSVCYIIHEMSLRKYLSPFQTNHQTVPYYMNAAYYWLGWGIHGNRTKHTYSFLTKLQ